MIAHTQEELLNLLAYDRKTGILVWRTSAARRVKTGAVAGSLHPQGYVMVQVQKKIYAAHRLIWKMFYGDEPDVVDHINGNRADNRLANLRNVTRSENLQLYRKTRNDSTTGLLGVTYRADCNKYQAKLRRNGKTQHLGTFTTPEEAHRAYCVAKGLNK